VTSYPKIFCAIDTPDLPRARDLSCMMRDVGCGIKLGLEFFSSHGAAGVREILRGAKDVPVFLDLKFHDIPNTTAAAVAACRDIGVAYINLHASGGVEMMMAANAQKGDMKLLAVTVLTALDAQNLNAVGQGDDVAAQVLRLAQLTKDSCLDGVVCSAHEIKNLRRTLGDDFVLMVPGIRPAGSDVGDQKRVMTPRAAMDAGATHLVIGRPITGAKNPAEAATAILQEI
jgi:orotidine-5'-phosphate decarboxylase